MSLIKKLIFKYKCHVKRKELLAELKRLEKMRKEDAGKEGYDPAFINGQIMCILLGLEHVEILVDEE